MNTILTLLTSMFLLFGVREIANEKVQGAYTTPPATAHDLYRVAVVAPDGVCWTVIAVEMPFSFHSTSPGLYVVPLDLNLKQLVSELEAKTIDNTK